MRPTFLEVNLNQLKINLQNIRAHTDTKIMTMVKANAYGHGIDGVAPFIESYTDCFGVALVEEGIHLRQLGIKKPILIAGGTLIEQLPFFFEHDLILTASSLDLLTASDHLAKSSGKRLKVHLKIDTGMERVGVHEYEAEEFLIRSLACSQNTEIEGIYTHLANSETMSLREELRSNSTKQSPKQLEIASPLARNDGFVDAKLQLERFQEVLSFYEKIVYQLPCDMFVTLVES
ncbi:MAG: hypothetical protein HC797_03325 [Anaerolineales bacterium]|nr:hypothetical protein [Anaerolineales bacterium]